MNLPNLSYFTFTKHFPKNALKYINQKSNRSISFQDDTKKLEDSWDWDTEKSSKSSDQYVKVQASVDSDDSSGGELVNIPLEIGVAEKNFEKLQEEKSVLQSKVFDLEKENGQLSKGIEELDTQHTEALQEMLQIKEEIQRELTATKVGLHKKIWIYVF